MNALFVDTAGWATCADATDSQHAAAIAARDGWLEEGGILLTTDYVIDETLTLLRFRLGLQAAERWWQQIDGSSRVRCEFVNESRAEKARGLFFRYRDKQFSFTDCTSFAIMRELKIRETLTSDRHFAQMGFAVKPAR